MFYRHGLEGGNNILSCPGNSGHLCSGLHPRQIHYQSEIQVPGCQRLPASNHDSDVKISRRVFSVLQMQTITSEIFLVTHILQVNFKRWIMGLNFRTITSGELLWGPQHPRRRKRVSSWPPSRQETCWTGGQSARARSSQDTSSCHRDPGRGRGPRQQEPRAAATQWSRTCRSDTRRRLSG